MREALPHPGGRAFEAHLEETGMAEIPRDDGGERTEQQSIPRGRARRRRPVFGSRPVVAISE